MSESDLDIDFTRCRLSWSSRLRVGALEVGGEQIVDTLGTLLTDERRVRLQEVVASRSLHLVSVLENIYDRGNISAVMRSSEAFGFLGMNILDAPGSKFKAANRVARGADKWLDVQSYAAPAALVGDLKASGYQIWATDLNSRHSIDDLDWSRPMAIVLGNENSGVSPEMSALVDGHFHIPMLGFSQSLNISVAAALIFYRAHMEIKRLPGGGRLGPIEQQQVLANYYLRCFDNPELLLKNKLNL